MCNSTIAIPRNQTAATSSYTCTIGLIYDGTPIDLTPKLTMDGVTFSFLDTSSSETRFDIFVGELGGLDQNKASAVTISPGQLGCGRTANPISVVDKLSWQMVGQIREYGITATQVSINASSTISVCNASSSLTYGSTGITKLPYRIPFLAQISGYVKSSSGDAMPGVAVSYCHIDQMTQTDYSDPNFCPLFTVTSDVFGRFVQEVRVSDRLVVTSFYH
jgi:hypothetical protein